MQFWKGQVVTYGMWWYMVLVPQHFSKTAGKYLSLIIRYNLMILLFLGTWTICIFLCKYVMASGYEKQSTFTFKGCESCDLNKRSMSTICNHNSNIGKKKFIGESIFEQLRPKESIFEQLRPKGNPLVHSIGVVESTKKRFIRGTGMKVHITETCVETSIANHISATQKSCRAYGSYAPVRTRATESHKRQTIIFFTGAISDFINLNTMNIVLIKTIFIINHIHLHTEHISSSRCSCSSGCSRESPSNRVVYC